MTMKGLTTEQALQSRAVHGSNTLTPQRRKSLWALYFEKYKDPIIQILLVAAAISLVLSLVNNDFVKIENLNKMADNDATPAIFTVELQSASNQNPETIPNKLTFVKP